MKDYIQEIMKELRKEGRFKNPEEVDKFFEEKLKETVKKTIGMVGFLEGWEESIDYYLKELL